MITNKIYLLLLFIVGLINFLPIIGVLSLDKINQSYGLMLDDNNLAILLRHRALLFGLLGGFIFYSLFNPQHQIVAMVLAAISMLGYLYFFYSIGESNAALLKVAYVDIIGVVILGITAVMKLSMHHI